MFPFKPQTRARTLQNAKARVLTLRFAKPGEEQVQSEIYTLSAQAQRIR
jgi:hypothetical protein